MLSQGDRQHAISNFGGNLIWICCLRQSKTSIKAPLIRDIAMAIIAPGVYIFFNLSSALIDKMPFSICISISLILIPEILTLTKNWQSDSWILIGGIHRPVMTLLWSFSAGGGFSLDDWNELLKSCCNRLNSSLDSYKFETITTLHFTGKLGFQKLTLWDIWAENQFF